MPPKKFIANRERLPVLRCFAQTARRKQPGTWLDGGPGMPIADRPHAHSSRLACSYWNCRVSRAAPATFLARRSPRRLCQHHTRRADSACKPRDAGALPAGRRMPGFRNSRPGGVGYARADIDARVARRRKRSASIDDQDPGHDPAAVRQWPNMCRLPIPIRPSMGLPATRSDALNSTAAEALRANVAGPERVPTSSIAWIATVPDLTVPFRILTTPVETSLAVEVTKKKKGINLGCRH